MGIYKDEHLSARTELRCHAEERLCANSAESHPPRTKETMVRLVHELEVHQIELEMQNEELIQAQQELELSRNNVL